MKKFMLGALPVFLLLLATAFTSTEDWQDKVDTEILEKTADGASTDFIILIADNTDLSAAESLDKNGKAQYVYDALRQRADATQANVAAVLQDAGATFQAYFIVNMIYTAGNIDLIQNIAEMPEVEKIQVNPVAMTERLQPSTAAGARTTTWGIQMINADDVWALGYTGQNVTVGGQDTGYEWEHPALKARYRGWDGTNADHDYNWHDSVHEQSPLNEDANNPCGFDVEFPCDDNNHGTHTMGTMVGSDGDNEIGVAPDAKWMACRNMERGWGQLTTYVECFEWFLAPTKIDGSAPDPTKAPHVIANSWGCPDIEGCNPDNFAVMETAVDNLRAAGTFVVVSAGNSGNQGCSTVENPAAIFENSFSVGATNEADDIAGFSSRGPVTVDNSGRRKPDVSAPGVGVLSSIRGGGYASFNGTSMAGPHVAGAVALIISANPALAGDVETLENILEQTAVGKTTEEDCGDIDGDAIPNNTYGYGRIDVLAAVNAALDLISDTDNPELNSALSVSPNPFTGSFSLNFSQSFGAAEIEIYDTAGRLVRSLQRHIAAGDAVRIDLKDAAAGVYFYSVRHETGTLEGKVLGR